MPVKKLPTSQLKIGMFIASLDRPWSETPFLFQGFPVNTQEELKELNRLTQHVYIMVPDEEVELHGMPASSIEMPDYSKIIGREKYQTTATYMDEIHSASTSHTEISQLITEVKDLIETSDLLHIEKLRRPIKTMVCSIIKNPDAYIWLTQIKKYDSYTYKESLMSSVLATVIGRQLGIVEEDLQTLATGVLLMDIGKTVLPKEILHKQSSLTCEEWEQVKSHVPLGLDILRKTNDYPAEILDIVSTHHERLDGSGYPAGLSGGQIPLFGQIAGLVDFYVATTTTRPFAKPISPSVAMQMLYEQEDHYFYKKLVDALIQSISTYPTGSLVELSSGEVGIVISQTPGIHLKPNIVLLLNPHKKPYQIHLLVSLLDYTYGHGKKAVYIRRTLPEGKFGLQIEQIIL